MIRTVKTPATIQESLILAKYLLGKGYTTDTVIDFMKSKSYTIKGKHFNATLMKGQMSGLLEPRFAIKKVKKSSK